MSNLEPGDTIYIHSSSPSLSSEENEEKAMTLVDKKNENTLILSQLENGIRKYWDLTWNGQTWLLKDPVSVDDDGQEVSVQFSKRTQVIQSRLREEPESPFTRHYLTDLLILSEASMEDFASLVATNRQMYYLANNPKFENQLYRPRFIKYLSQYLGKDNEQFIEILDELISNAQTECFNIFLDKKEKMLQKHYSDEIQFALAQMTEEEKEKYQGMSDKDFYLTLIWKHLIAPDRYWEDAFGVMQSTYDKWPDKDKEAFQICSWKDIYGAFKIMQDLNIVPASTLQLNFVNLEYFRVPSENRALESNYLIKLLYLMKILIDKIKVHPDDFEDNIRILFERLATHLKNTNNYCLMYLFNVTYYLIEHLEFCGSDLYNMDLYQKILDLDIFFYYLSNQTPYVQILLKSMNADAYLYFVSHYSIQNLDNIIRDITFKDRDITSFFNILNLSEEEKFRILDKFETQIKDIRIDPHFPFIRDGLLTPDQVQWAYFRGAQFDNWSFLLFLRTENIPSIMRLQHLGIYPNKSVCKIAQKRHKHLVQYLECP